MDYFDSVVFLNLSFFLDSKNFFSMFCFSLCLCLHQVYSSSFCRGGLEDRFIDLHEVVVRLCTL